jgi:hypothetical protein
MMQNIGRSIGIAGLSTLLSVRERFHSERIGESVTVYSGALQQRLQQATAYFMSQGSDPSSAHMRAIGAIGGVVRRESISARIQRLFPGLGLCFARKRNCSAHHEKSTYHECGWWTLMCNNGDGRYFKLEPSNTTLTLSRQESCGRPR